MGEDFVNCRDGLIKIVIVDAESEAQLEEMARSVGFVKPDGSGDWAALLGYVFDDWLELLWIETQNN